MDKVYLLVEDDDNCDLSCRVFTTAADASAVFAETLRKYFNKKGYHPTYIDEGLHTFTECIEIGNFVEDGYWLTIREKAVE